MKYITLNNDLKMPIIGFGTAQLKGAQCEKTVLNALNIGYRLIYTAQIAE